MMYMLLTCNTFYHHCYQFVQGENVHEFGELTCYWVAVGEPSYKMRTALSPTSKND